MPEAAGGALRVLIDQVQAVVDRTWSEQIHALSLACRSGTAASAGDVLHVRRLALEIVARGPAPAWSADRWDRIAAIARADSLPGIGEALRHLDPDDGPRPGDGLNRWSAAVVRIVGSPRDPQHVPVWAQLINVSPHTVRTWCRTANLSVKRSLDLGRLLRAAQLSRRSNAPIGAFLDIAHPHTLRRFGDTAVLDMRGTARPLHEVLARQRFVVEARAVDALRARLPCAAQENTSIAEDVLR